jgi:hypothetical protein
MGHGKSLRRFDGPPNFLYVHGWATKQKPMHVYLINNKSKQNYPNYQMMLFVYTTTRSGRITANTTNWRAAQYRNYCDEYVGQAWWNYIRMLIQCRCIFTKFIPARFCYYN